MYLAEHDCGGGGRVHDSKTGFQAVSLMFLILPQLQQLHSSKLQHMPSSLAVSLVFLILPQLHTAAIAAQLLIATSAQLHSCNSCTAANCNICTAANWSPGCFSSVSHPTIAAHGCNSCTLQHLHSYNSCPAANGNICTAAQLQTGHLNLDQTCFLSPECVLSPHDTHCKLERCTQCTRRQTHWAH